MNKVLVLFRSPSANRPCRMQIIPFSFRLYADRHGGREQWAEDDCVVDRPRRQTNKKEEDQPETGFALEVTSANFFLEVQGLLGKMPKKEGGGRQRDSTTLLVSGCVAFLNTFHEQSENGEKKRNEYYKAFFFSLSQSRSQRHHQSSSSSQSLALTI